MAAIDQYLRQILKATYGEEVRHSIHDAILQNYMDVSESVAQANAAADLAEQALADASTVVDKANSAAQNANEKATLADTKAALADTAADRANEIADTIDAKISALSKILADDYENTNTKLEELFNAIDTYGPQEETASEIAREILKSGAYFKSMADATDIVKEDE